MGCILSQEQRERQKAIQEESKKNRQHDAELQRRLEADGKEEEDKLKLLFLGTGESGKSTIFKQMKLIYSSISHRERMTYKEVIRCNVIEDFQQICDAIYDFGFDDQLEENDALHFIQGLRVSMESEYLRKFEDNTKFIDQLTTFWSNDPACQAVWERKEVLHLPSSLSHFMKGNLSRLFSPSYIPTDDDILKARIRTTGIHNEVFNVMGKEVEMYDVGGQRNERRKWIHCFDKVNAIIFVVALSEYDQVLFEDERTNRMEDSLNLFESICSNKLFKDTSIVLFLNKSDLFAEKVAKRNINTVPHFIDYSGYEHSYEDGIEYFRQKFLDRNRFKDREIRVYVTCATSTPSIETVFASVHQMLLEEQESNVERA